MELEQPLEEHATLLASERVGELWAALREVAAAHYDQLDSLAAAYLGDRAGLEQITRDELARRLHDGDVVIIDVRPLAEVSFPTSIF